jgi:hypothetical protein
MAEESGGPAHCRSRSRWKSACAASVCLPVARLPVGDPLADSPAFDWVCVQLEERSALDRLEARGTVRLALKQAGLEARNITPDQMVVILDKVLPGELLARGVSDEHALCSAISTSLKSAKLDAGGDESPDEVFRRLGGS